jgi:hypothetical protein
LAATWIFLLKLTDLKSHYSTIDREILAAQAAIKHFRHFCEGCPFQLWADHKPLVTALSHVSVPICLDNNAIWRLSQNSMYLPGLKNVVADFLSRPLPESTETVTATGATDPVDFKEMGAEQNRCAEMQRLLGVTSLKFAFRQIGARSLAGDASTGIFCPIVPLKFRKDIFAHFHNFAHPGRLASHHIISSRFVWHGLSSNITAWTRECLACQRGKIHRHACLAPSAHPCPTMTFFSPSC